MNLFCTSLISSSMESNLKHALLSFECFRASKRLNLTSSSCTRIFIKPSSVFIIILAVFMNVRPKIRGTSSSSSISITTKSIGNKNLSTLTKISFVMPDGRVMDLLANYSVIFMFFIPISPIRMITNKWIRLTLEPRSINAFPMFMFPIIKVKSMQKVSLNNLNEWTPRPYTSFSPQGSPS